jgi:hypothetical protein
MGRQKAYACIRVSLVIKIRAAKGSTLPVIAMAW